LWGTRPPRLSPAAALCRASSVMAPATARPSSALLREARTEPPRFHPENTALCVPSAVIPILGLGSAPFKAPRPSSIPKTAARRQHNGSNGSAGTCVSPSTSVIIEKFREYSFLLLGYHRSVRLVRPGVRPRGSAGKRRSEHGPVRSQASPRGCAT